MYREIKFKANHKETKQERIFDLKMIADLRDGFSSWENLRGYIGLKDKNDKEIYEGSLLRIKGKMGDKGEYSFDAIYSVNEMSYEGVSLNFVKLFSQSPDSVDNSYPINHCPSFRNRSLCTDYRNSNYSHIAFDVTSGENGLSGTTWKEHHYTNDIEVIGSIYKNPELLN